MLPCHLVGRQYAVDMVYDVRTPDWPAIGAFTEIFQTVDQPCATSISKHWESNDDDMSTKLLHRGSTGKIRFPDMNR